MIGVDTNILVYAHRPESPWHAAAEVAVRGLAEGSASWCIPWPCIHEFLSTVTHPRIFKPPSSLAVAARQVEFWFESSSLVMGTETERHWTTLRNLAIQAKLAGPAFHDARIAAICIDHGVTELWSADRDFSRFGGVRVVNPLVGG